MKTSSVFSALIAGLLLATASSAFAGWYSTGGTWTYRKAITIDHTKIPNTDQSSFPVLVSLTSDADLSARALGNGFDILFTSSDGITKISYEREYYSSGTLVAWVNVATLSHTADTVLYLYYGNASATDQQAATSVWDANYKAVWHMKEATGANLADSTSAVWTETQSGSPTQTASQIDGGLSFNGTSQYANHATSASSPFRYGNQITYSFWANLPTGGGGNVMGVSCGGGQGFGGVSLYLTSLGFTWTPTNPGSDNGINSSPLSLTAGQWAHVVVAIDFTGQTRHFYVNGSEVTTTLSPTAAPPNWTPNTTYNSGRNDEIGGRIINSQTYFNGKLDEVRVSSSIRSADWVKTEYNNQSSPGTFYSLGGQQVQPTKLAITSVNGGSNPTAGTGFSVVVQAQDATGTAASVTADTAVTLSRNTGSGTLGGTLTGTITAGSSSVTISGVTYTKAESGVSLTATRTSGDSLTAGNSSAFTVNPGAVTKLAITSVNGGANPTAGTAFSVVVQSQDANGNAANVVAGTDVSLSLNTGTGTLGGTLTGTITAGTSSVTISGVTYTKGESGVILTATRTSGDSLAAGNSSAFTVNPIITSSAGANGTISPSGVTAVSYNGSQTYTITPNSGFVVNDVLVDGSSVGAKMSYAFTSVTANHTISVTFASSPVTVGSGLTYTVTETDNKLLYTFTAGSGPFTPSIGSAADLLVVGGGGGGGGAVSTASYYGGGGGGGDVVAQSGASLTGGNPYTVTVGSGGAGNSGAAGSAGNQSVFGSYTAVGGGGGGGGIGTAAQNIGGNGASSGGGGRGSGNGNAGTASAGFAGAVAASGRGGGGGGDGAVGSNQNGGNGAASSITGTPVTYAGGGGGGGTTAGTGGAGGGGAGALGSGSTGGNGVAGTANLGGGGGGGANGTSSAAARTGGAGGYGVVIVSYTIKSTPTVTAWPTASGITYGQTLNSSILSGGTASVAGTFAWTTPSTAPNAGTASYSVTFTPTDTAHYNPLVGSVSVNVSQATPTLSVVNSPVTYNGSPQAATVNGSVLGTVSNVKYGGSATVPTAAGTYAITADFAPTDFTDYNSLTAASAGNFVINKATPTLSVANSPAYTGSPQAATVNGSVAGSASNVKYAGSATIPTAAGTYAITADFAPTDSTDYNSLTATSAGNFIIQKATPIVTVTVGSYIYTGSAQGPNSVITSPVSTGAVTYSYQGVSGTTYGPSPTPPTGAGSYAVTATVAADANNNSASSSATPFSIAKATPTVTVTVGTYTYSGAAQGPNSVTTSPVSTGAATYSYLGVSGTTYGPSATPPTGAGSYTVTATVAADANNNSASSSATPFTIDQATPTLSVGNSPVTYNASPQAATVNGSAPGTVSNVKYNGSATVPTAVGTYAITADFAPTDSTDYDSLTGASAGNFVINPGPLDHFSIPTIASPQTAGTPITGITITAQDVYNNTVTSFNGAGSTVTYSGTAGITGTSGNFSSGVLNGVSVTPTVAGSSRTFIVTGPAGSGSKTGTSAFDVNPGAIASYAVSASPSPATRGTPFNVTVTAKDANNNTVNTDNSTVVAMTSSTGNVLFDGAGDSSFNDNTVTLSSGTFTISTKDNYFETVTITATDANSKTGNTSVTVNPASGDYESYASGNWNGTTTWQTWNGTAWSHTTTPPPSAFTGEINVQGGFTVTVSASASVPSSLFVLNSGSAVSISSGQTLTVGNGVANGVISGSGILAESGAGNVLTLNGANSYSGGTIISYGTVSAANVNSSGNLGTGGITFDHGGTLRNAGTGSQTFAASVTLNTGGGVIAMSGTPINLTGTISSGGGLTCGGGDLILNRASGNNAIGAITVNSGRLFVFTMGSINGSSIAVQNGATLDFSVSGGASPANTMTFASGACLANRSGTLTLSAATGFPTAGTMIFNQDDSATTAITVNGAYPALTGALTFQLGGANTTVGTVTLSGAISGSFGLTKTLNGTLILGSANSYTGGTTVSAGTLDAHVAGSLSTRDVNVASGAVLQLDTSTGMSSTARLLLNGATPSVTLSSGINQIVGALSFDGGATFAASGTWGASGKTHNDSRFTGTGTLTVTPIAITVTAASNTKAYDGTTGAAAIPTLTTGTLATGDTATYSETYSTKDAGAGNKTLIPAVTIKNSGNVNVTASYSITLNSVSIGTISPKALAVSGITAGSTIYDGTTTAKLGGTAAFLTAEAPGTGTTSDGIPYTVDSVSPGTTTGTLAAKDVGTENVTTSLAVIGTGNGNYTVTPQAGLTQQITPKALTVTGITAASTTYDGTTSAKLGGPAAFLGTEAAGAGNTGDGKPYSVDAVSPGAVTGTLAAKDVGAQIVTITGVTVTGAGNGNYTVTPPTGLTQQVTPKALTAPGTLVFPASKVYEGTTTATPTSGSAALQTTEGAGAGTTADGKPYSVDSVSLTGTASYAYNSKDVATATTVTESGLSLIGTGNGNYILTAPSFSRTITAKALTVTGITAASTTYDGTTTAKLGGTAAFPSAEATGTGTTSDGIPYSVDSVTPGTVTGTLAAKDVGTQNVTTSVAVTGTGSGNYTVTPQAGLTQQITAKALTVTGITAASTIYDGTMTAKLSGAAAFLGTEAAGTGTTSDGKPYSVDNVSPGGTAAGTLAAKDVGSQNVTITGVTVTGTGNGNYTVTQQTGLTQSVTAKALTVSGITAGSTVYDGTTTAKLGGTAAFQAPEGAGAGNTGDGKPYSVDAVSPGGTAAGTLASKSVGSRAVTITGVTVTGTGSGNYTVTQQTGLTQSVTAKAIDVTAVSDTKPADGTTSSTGQPTINPALVGGDTSGFIQTFDTAAAGTGKTLTPSGSANDGNSGNNYSVTFHSVSTGTITPGAIASYTLSAAAATRGTAFNVTVTAKDAYGNVVTSDNSTVVTMTASTGNVLFDANGDGSFNDNVQTLSSGTFTISTKDMLAETVTITARDGNGKTGNASVTINGASGDFRSIASANWNVNTTWQTWNGSAWVAASSTPTGAAGVAITLQSAYTVTDNVAVSLAGLLDVQGTLSFSGSGAITVGSGGIVRNSGTINSSASTLIFSSGGTYQHNFTTTAGTIPTATWAIGSACTIVGYTTDTTQPTGLGQSFDKLTWNCPGQSAIVNVNTVIATVNNTFTVASTGTGVLTLSAANTYAGATVIAGGTVQLGQSGLAVTVPNYSFEAPVIGSPYYQYTPSGASWTFAGAGIAHQNSSNPWWSSTYAPPDGSQGGFVQGGGYISQSLSFPNPGKYTISFSSIGRAGTLGPNPMKLQLDGADTGFTWTPTQTAWTLYNTSFTISTAGNHTVSFQGTAVTDLSSCIDNVVISGFQPNRLPASTSLSIASGAVLDLNGVSQTVASLSDYGTGGGTVINRAAAGNPVALTLGTASGTATFGGAVGDGTSTVALVKTGNSTQVLTGASTYTGGTTVNDGTLRVDGQTGSESATGSGAVVVNAGGTLSGDGRIAGAVTVANNSFAVLYPNSSSTLTLGGNLTFSGSSAGADFDLSSSASSGNDKVVLESKTLTCGSARITINSAGTLDSSDYVLFDAGSSGTISGSFNSTPVFVGTAPKYSAGYSVVTGTRYVTLHYAPIALTVTAVVNTKTYDGTISAAATPSLTGTLGSGDTAALTEIYTAPNAGTGNKTLIPAITIKDSGNVDVTANYTIILNSVSTGTINPKALTAAGTLSAPASKVYDGTTSASVSGAAALQTPEATGSGTTSDGTPYSVDSVSLTGTASYAYNSKDVATATAVTESGLSLTGAGSGNYTLTAPSLGATITRKTLTMSGLSVPGSKVYDGTTAATVSGTAALQGTEVPPAGTTLDGKPYSVDSVSLTGTATGTYNSKDVASAATVTFGGVSLTGTGNGNYTLTPQSAASATITTKTLTALGTLSISSKVYDGTTSATPSGAAALLAAEATSSGNTLDGKPYTGNGDAVSLTGTASYAYNSKDVGTATTVTESGLSLIGTGSGNYTLTAPSLSAGITAKALTAVGTLVFPASKVYDGTTTATPTSGSAALLAAETTGSGNTLDGKPYTGNGDAVSLTGTASYAFNSKDVATATTVTESGLSLTGTGIGNYTLTAPSVGATITRKTLTMSGLSVPGSKVYDGTAAAVVSGTAALQATEVPPAGTTSDGKPYSVDSVSLTGTATGTYNSKDVASAATVTFGGVSLTGTGNGNYTLAIQSAASATITAKALTVTGLTVASKTYDGTTTVTFTGLAALLTAESPGSGTTSDNKPYTGDTVSVTGTPSGVFANANAGTGISVIVSGLSLTGAQSGDYTLTQPTFSADINARPVQLSGTRVYDATTAAPAGILTIVPNFDGPNLTLSGSGTLVSKDVGSRALAATYAPLARVQSATGSTAGSAASSFSVTVTTPVNGNTLVAVISTRGTTPNRVSNLSQAGAAWTRVSQAANASAIGDTTEIWYAPNVSGAGTTVTINLAASLYASAVVAEYRGVLTAGAVDQTANAFGNSSYPATGTTPTTTQNNELWVGGIGLNTSAYTVGSIVNSFFIIANAQSSSATDANDASVYAMDRIVSSAGAAASGGTCSSAAGIAQRGSATTANNSGNSVTIPMPTGVVAGDVMIATIAEASLFGLFAPTPPANWNLINGGQLGSLFNYGAVFYKVADASDVAGTTYAFGLNTLLASAVGDIVAFSGVDYTGGFNQAGAAGGPFDVDPGTISVAPGSQTGVAAATITTASANAAVIMCGMAAGSAAWSGWTTTPPGALTEIADNQSGLASVGVAWALKATAGSTGAGGATLSSAQNNGGILLALKPVPAPQWSGAIATFKATPTAFVGLTLGGTAAPNYTMTGASGSVTITPKTLNYTGISAARKVYDGTTTASFSGTANTLTPEAPGSSTSDGAPYTGDTVSFTTGTLTGTFADNIVANGKPVTLTGGVTLTAGGQSADYSVGSPNAALTADIYLRLVPYTRSPSLALRIAISDLFKTGHATDNNGVGLTFWSVTSQGGNSATIIANSAYVLYTPGALSGNVSDSFTYSVNPGGGSGTVNITMAGAQPGSPSGSISVSGGVATVTMYGIPGVQYDVQRSTDLSSWTTLSSSLSPTPPIPASAADGSVRFTDNFSDLGTPPSSAYYRIVQH